jgi:type VI secretion system protein ImpK
MTNNVDKMRLAGYCHDLLNMVLKMQIANDFGDAAVFRDKISDLINQIEIKAQKNACPAAEINHTKFALIAFVDECVITSDWDQREDWIANPLQMEIYGRFDAGDEFFTRLETFLQNPGENAAVTGVYYTCLGLGFKGKYAIDGEEELRLLISKTNDALKRTVISFPELLSPSGVPEKSVRSSDKKFLSWYLGFGTILLALIFYLIITLISINAVDKALEVLP